MMRFAASLLLLATFAVQAHEDPLKIELHELLNDFLAGASRNDADMHDRFWAEDLVYTSSSGARFGKAAILKGLANAADDSAAGPTYSGRDIQIRVFDDTAVITFQLVATDAGGSETLYYNTGVFRRSGGQWRAIVWQATIAGD